MAVNQTQFDTALATLVSDDAAREAVLQSLVTNVGSVATDVAAIDSALTKFIADYNTKNGVDLTNELASVTQLSSVAVADTAALNTAVGQATASGGTLTTDSANVVAADPNA